MTPALDRVLPLLHCPVCGAGFARDAGTLRCGGGHAFDLARQGYVTLLAGGRPHRGDTADMVAARDRFLTSGHYATVAAAVSRAANTAPPGPLLDLAGGTGWYAARVLDADPARAGVAIDVSTAALKRAARAHDRLAAVGADAWGALPVRDGAFTTVLSVFGPRTAAEAARVLGPGGVVVTVTPSPDHLREIIGPLGMLDVADDKSARLRETFGAFAAGGSERVARTLALGPADLADLAGMGPAGHHLGRAEIAGRVAALPDTVEVTVSVDVTTFRRP